MKKIIFILLCLTKQPLKNVFTSFGVITVLHCTISISFLCVVLHVRGINSNRFDCQFSICPPLLKVNCLMIYCKCLLRFDSLIWVV